MLRRPPRSTLFPTRRSSDLKEELRRLAGQLFYLLLHRLAPAGPRSEEHTSELQSHSDLVCRLLLEKKKWRLSFQRRVTFLTSPGQAVNIVSHPLGLGVLSSH